ncbi:MAG: 2TM domain-containing protein [Aestuariivita sp.]|nr:2TM domain-containing protein [Aestuariivita sp.]MCY4346422.1 2TM domain-containing protein [Aestuariivita sp.]
MNKVSHKSSWRLWPALAYERSNELNAEQRQVQRRLKCLAAALNTEFVELRKEQEMSAETTGAGTMLSQDEQEAMEYVRDIRGFYAHAVQYVVIIAALLVINLVTNPSYLWFLWAAFGWGIGLMVHGLTVFEIINLFGDNWEKRQVSKRLAKIRSYRKDNN